MIKNITAFNYKSFKNFDVNLAPITLFVGPNNSGKSSAVSLIRLLSQTSESSDPNVRLLLDGPLGDFGTYKDIIHGNEARRHLGISFTINAPKQSVIPTDSIIKLNLHFKYRSSLKETVLKKVECFGDQEHHLTAEYNEDSERFLVRRVGNTDVPRTLASSNRFRAFDIRNFLPRQVFTPTNDTSNEELAKLVQLKSRLAGRNSIPIARAFREIEYVGAMRLPPTRTYLYTDGAPCLRILEPSWGSNVSAVAVPGVELARWREMFALNTPNSTLEHKPTHGLALHALLAAQRTPFSLLSGKTTSGFFPSGSGVSSTLSIKIKTFSLATHRTAHRALPLAYERRLPV